MKSKDLNLSREQKNPHNFATSTSQRKPKMVAVQMCDDMLYTWQGNDNVNKCCVRGSCATECRLYDRRAERNSGRGSDADKTWVRSLAPSQEAPAPPFLLSLPLSKWQFTHTTTFATQSPGLLMIVGTKASNFSNQASSAHLQRACEESIAVITTPMVEDLSRSCC